MRCATVTRRDDDARDDAIPRDQNLGDRTRWFFRTVIVVIDVRRAVPRARSERETTRGVSILHRVIHDDDAATRESVFSHRPSRHTERFKRIR